MGAGAAFTAGAGLAPLGVGSSRPSGSTPWAGGSGARFAEDQLGRAWQPPSSSLPFLPGATQCPGAEEPTAWCASQHGAAQRLPHLLHPRPHRALIHLERASLCWGLGGWRGLRLHAQTKRLPVCQLRERKPSPEPGAQLPPSYLTGGRLAIRPTRCMQAACLLYRGVCGCLSARDVAPLVGSPRPIRRAP